MDNEKPTYEKLLTCLRAYAEAQQACGHPASPDNLRQYRRWKNMPQDADYDGRLLRLISGK